jgi:hypothetical protein
VGAGVAVVEAWSDFCCWATAPRALAIARVSPATPGAELWSVEPDEPLEPEPELAPEACWGVVDGTLVEAAEPELSLPEECPRRTANQMAANRTIATSAI